MFCENCGNPLNENAKFCGKCGAVNSDSNWIKVPTPEKPQGKQSSWSIFSFSKEELKVAAVTAGLALGGIGLLVLGAQCYDLYFVDAPEESLEQTVTTEAVETSPYRDGYLYISKDEFYNVDTGICISVRDVSSLNVEAFKDTLNGATFYPDSPLFFSDDTPHKWHAVYDDDGVMTDIGLSNIEYEVVYRFRIIGTYAYSGGHCELEAIIQPHADGTYTYWF